METTIDIIGAKELAKELRRLKLTAARRIVSAAVRDGAAVLRAEVRRQVPSKYRKARSGFNMRKLRPREVGYPGWKVGANVGKVRRGKKRRSVTRPGVGWSRYNSGWLISGGGAPGWPGGRHKPRQRRGGESTGVFPRKMETMSNMLRVNQSRVLRAMENGKTRRLREEIKHTRAFQK